MECKWCKEEIKDDAKICPKCGKAVWKEKQKKGAKILGIIVGILFVILLLIVIIVATSSPDVESKCENAEFANLEEIYKLHANDVPKAEELYKDKYFKFKGTIDKKYKSHMLVKSDYIAADVYFVSEYKDKAYEHEVKDKITYCGRVTFGLGIDVKDSILIEEKKDK